MTATTKGWVAGMHESGSRRWWALGSLVICLLTLGLDATILNVALPTLATALQAGTGALQWIVDAYILVFAGLLLPLGALGDRVGRKRMLLVGLVVFLGASVGAAYVTSAGQLIAARVVMGVGSAILTPVALAMLPVLFSPAERPRAIAAVASAMGIGVPLGPIVGGYLLDHFWWGSVFLVNVPVAVIGIVAAMAFIPESRDPRPRRSDALGGVLSTAGLVLLVYGVIEVPRRGWASPVVVGATLGGVLLLTVFSWWERRCAYAMIDVTLFGRARFLWGTVAATIAGFALFGLLFTLPPYLQSVQGNDALGTGLRLVPMMGGLLVGAAGSDRISARLGTRIPVAAGLAIVAAGLGLGATTAVGDPYSFMATWLGVVGLGVGLALAPAMDAVLGELPPDQAGSGTAVTMTLRQVGAALGIALVGSVAANVYRARLDLSALPASLADVARESVSGATAVALRLPAPALRMNAALAYVHAMDVVLVVCAAISVAGAIAVAIALPSRPVSGRSESVHELSRVA